MTDEEIQLVINSLEDGDEVIVTSGEGYYQAEVRGRVSVDRFFDVGLMDRSLRNFNITSIQVVSKGTPKWHRAKVISAEVKDTKTPQYFLRDGNYERAPWTDAAGDYHSHDEIENVVIIVGEDG